MQAVDQDHLVGAHSQRRHIELAFARLEIVIREQDLVAGDEPLEVFVDQGQIKRLGRLEIVIAVLIPGMHFQVVEVVVDVQGHEAQPCLLQTFLELRCCRGLGRR